MSPRYTLSRTEKLKQKKLIDHLFLENQNRYKYPLKVLYQLNDKSSNDSVKFGVSVSKKLHKTAVARNLLKRRVREAYRLNKNLLVQQFLESDKSLILMFLYVSKQTEPYDLIESSMKNLLIKLNEEFSA